MPSCILDLPPELLKDVSGRVFSLVATASNNDFYKHLYKNAILQACRALRVAGSAHLSVLRVDNNTALRRFPRLAKVKTLVFVGVADPEWIEITSAASDVLLGVETVRIDSGMPFPMIPTLSKLAEACPKMRSLSMAHSDLDLDYGGEIGRARGWDDVGTHLRSTHPHLEELVLTGLLADKLPVHYKNLPIGLKKLHLHPRGMIVPICFVRVLLKMQCLIDVSFPILHDNSSNSSDIDAEGCAWEKLTLRSLPDYKLVNRFRPRWPPSVHLHIVRGHLDSEEWIIATPEEAAEASRAALALSRGGVSVRGGSGLRMRLGKRLELYADGRMSWALPSPGSAAALAPLAALLPSLCLCCEPRDVENMSSWLLDETARALPHTSTCRLLGTRGLHTVFVRAIEGADSAADFRRYDVKMLHGQGRYFDPVSRCTLTWEEVEALHGLRLPRAT